MLEPGPAEATCRGCAEAALRWGMWPSAPCSLLPAGCRSRLGGPSPEPGKQALRNAEAGRGLGSDPPKLKLGKLPPLPLGATVPSFAARNVALGARFCLGLPHLHKVLGVGPQDCLLMLFLPTPLPGLAPS